MLAIDAFVAAPLLVDKEFLESELDDPDALVSLCAALDIAFLGVDIELLDELDRLLAPLLLVDGDVNVPEPAPLIPMTEIADIATCSLFSKATSFN